MVLEDTRQLYQHLRSVSDPVAFLVGFFANSPVGFAIWKADGHLLLTNLAFRDLFGSEPPPEYNILQDDVADPGIVDLIHRAFDGEVADVPTFWYDPRDLKQVTVTEGRRVAVSMTVFPVFDHNSEIEYVAAAYKDDTEVIMAQEILTEESEHLKQVVRQMEEEAAERKRAEDALRASEEAARAFQERLRTLHTLSVELAQAHTLDELYRKAVMFGCTQLGFDRLGLFLVSDDPNKAIGTYGVDDQGNIQDEHANWFLLDQSGLTWNTDRTRWNIVVKEDAQLWHNRQMAGIGWNALSILGHEANPVGWLAADNLIHRRRLQDEQMEVLSLYSAMLGVLILKKQAEEETLKLNEELEDRVRKRTAELEASNKELDSFSYSVSHDLRAPLRSIDGFSQALLEDHADKLDEEGQDYLNRVRAASQRMGQLTDDMLMLARVTRREINPKQINLSVMVQTIAEQLLKTHPEREVEFVIASDLEGNVDASLMGIVLENLLGNAWKYTSKKPHARIEFGALQRDSQTVYFVRDDGAGFDMAYAGKLFAPFQRLHKPSEFEGTGIGLATVQRIVMKHGGRVWAEGAVEQGATFYFTFGT